MNFFEHQHRARRQSRWLIVLFVIAVMAIIVAIDAVVLFTLGVTSASESGELLSANQLARSNAALLVGAAVVTAAVIGIASLVRTAGLRSGGGQVAVELGGTQIEADSRDPLRRRLNNVVEEIALAAGVPKPEVYVLEKELGINAFAAGYTAADAAIAVTRGALDTLSRDELQGVIAHEFSHILNGDMRVNIRLMGALFGILVLALIGRKVLQYAHLAGRGSRDKGAIAILAISAALMMLGYIGLFFGRWIKAAVSRQREYLADASAVQFTRNPLGIGGALKKIAVYQGGSTLAADTEEISHMLFGQGRKAFLFSTHPPIEDRIARVDPSFQQAELDELRKKLIREESRQRELEAEREARATEPARSGTPFDVDRMIEGIGNPEWERMLMAAALAASLPPMVAQSARSAEWAPEVLFYALLDADSSIREKQLLVIAQNMGSDSEQQVSALLQASGEVSPVQRLPLVEIAFPALKRRPKETIEKVLQTVQVMIEVDGRIEVFEYLLSRLVSQYLWESANPHRAAPVGNRSIGGGLQAVTETLSIVARHGHESDAGAEAAFEAGMRSLDIEAEMPVMQGWTTTLDRSLRQLDSLKPNEKERFVRALSAVVTHDGTLAVEELELMRVICDLIHVPLPMLSAVKSDPQTSPRS